MNRRDKAVRRDRGDVRVKAGSASKGEVGPTLEGASLSAHYNASRLRMDSWHRLGAVVVDLAERDISDRAAERAWREIGELIATLHPIELYWAFPGRIAFSYLGQLYAGREITRLEKLVGAIVRALASESYRSRSINLLGLEDEAKSDIDDGFAESDADRVVAGERPYFEVLVVDKLAEETERVMRENLRSTRRAEDRFVYDIVVVPSFEDALIAILFNYNIQAVVVRYSFFFKSRNRLEILARYLGGIENDREMAHRHADRSVKLGDAIKSLRPELDLYLVTDMAAEDLASQSTRVFRRIFYRQEDYLELHLNILRGVAKRYETPFFTALKEYARQPTGVFHAMPISRGKSLTKSHWIQDMIQFYGANIFLAETSATSGGLDSLLHPSGPLKRAQELAARAFGSDVTYLVTNGTSTANKIVVQALVRPGDIVLVDRDCHKSHHYGLMLAGAMVCYLDPYPLPAYSMCGAIPLSAITGQLLEYKRAGMLDRVRMLLLTNCTFDGVIYNVERVMEACLAIKPDLIFLWDEAWFAFASFHPTYRQRTGMAVAGRLRQRYRSGEYRAKFETWQSELGGLKPSDDQLAQGEAMPDPDRVRIRVYVTQSTHKTLTSLRQGSMIHVRDQDFRAKVEHAFHEAYMTHTSTSPNYQILASLDIGRRQVELEGFELVQKQVEMAMTLRERVKTHPLLAKWFHFLSMRDLIPADYRASGMEVYYDPARGWSRMEEAWASDEFALDPTRLNLFVGRTGVSGDKFRTKVLMDQYGIQVNKTSRNTVLFMTNIGTTRSSVAHLIEVLVRIAEELDEKMENFSSHERRLYQAKIDALTGPGIAVPPFGAFHAVFRDRPGANTPEGDMRRAFFMAYDEAACLYVSLLDGSFQDAEKRGETLVSAMFVTPYPPGFPILVPGQVVSRQIADFIAKLDVSEIHGYRPELGLRVFTEAAMSVAGI